MMDDLEPKHRRALVIGSLIGALLGAGAAYLMIKAPAELADGEEPEPITPGEILTLTGAAASLLRLVDNFRRRL
jgi:hypothetical protein